jgi:hypothetical protein
VVAVAGVSIVAGWVIYDHALAVVRAHGESGTVAWRYPGTIDGLIYSASMVLLDAARRCTPPPRLARWMLATGIGATLAVNVASGLRFGPVGALVALAVVGSYELVILVVYGTAVPGSAGSVPPDAAKAAREALERSIAGGKPLSQRELARRFEIPRSRAAAVIAREVTAAANGQAVLAIRKCPAGPFFPDPTGRLAHSAASFRRRTLRLWPPPRSTHLAFQLGRVRYAGGPNQHARMAEAPGHRQAPGCPRSGPYDLPSRTSSSSLSWWRTCVSEPCSSSRSACHVPNSPGKIRHSGWCSRNVASRISWLSTLSGPTMSPAGRKAARDRQGRVVLANRLVQLVRGRPGQPATLAA